jgi:methylenetetrahydrofolate dehydrogenase (NADP+)/methenyltetrahydrofolate cyclohydrolase
LTTYGSHSFDRTLKHVQRKGFDRLTATVLKGADVAASLSASLGESIAQLMAQGGRMPALATLMVGENASSAAYRQSIVRTFKRVGIAHHPIDLPDDATEQDLIETLVSLNNDETVTGVLTLMPLPDHLRAETILEHLSPLKDVDGITPTNAGRLHMGLPSLRPSTPQGGLELLDFYGIELAGQEVTIVGRSNVVGRPLASLLLQRNATVTVCHTRTRDLAAHTLRADIVCMAAGAPRLLRAEMIRPGAIVIDFGVNVLESGEMVGDADFDGLLDSAGAITPIPGGTGPVTALVLARNTVAAGFACLTGDLDRVDVVRFR